MKYYEMKKQWLEESRAIAKWVNLSSWRKLFTDKPIRTVSEYDLDKEGYAFASTFPSIQGSNLVLKVRYDKWSKDFTVYYEELRYPRHYCIEQGPSIYTTRLGCVMEFSSKKMEEAFGNLLNELGKALEQ